MVLMLLKIKLELSQLHHLNHSVFLTLEYKQIKYIHIWVTLLSIFFSHLQIWEVVLLIASKVFSFPLEWLQMIR